MNSRGWGEEEYFTKEWEGSCEDEGWRCGEGKKIKNKEMGEM